MSLHGLLRRASSLLGGTPSNTSKQAYVDGEIVFSKNNVCVHTPSQFRREGSSVHHPGYLVVRCRHLKKAESNCCTASCSAGQNGSLGDQTPEPAQDEPLEGGHGSTTLTLTWIPNDKLAKNHDLITQLSPDVCGSGGGLSRSCSPCRFSDTDSISVSSFCCGTDTPCTASIASKSYEESSTALISSDLSTSEAPTLNIQQLEAVKQAAYVDPVADLPADPPQAALSQNQSHLCSDQSLPQTAPQSASSQTAHSPENVSCPASAGVDLTDKSSPSSGDGPESCEDKDSAVVSPSTTYPSSSAEWSGGRRKDEDDPDTGVFLESGSSGSCSDLKELVVAALLATADVTSSDEGNGEEEDTTAAGTANGKECVGDDGTVVIAAIRACNGNGRDRGHANICSSNGVTSNCNQENGGHRRDGDVNETCLQSNNNNCAVRCDKAPKAPLPSVEPSSRHGSHKASQESVEGKDARRPRQLSTSDKSPATEEGSAASLGGGGGTEDTSFDSSPEPHVPTYGGIFTADAGEGVWFEGSAESMAYSANLAFPEWSGSVSSSWSSASSSQGGIASVQQGAALNSCCGSPAHGHQHPPTQQRHSRVAIFNVDLGEMRSLRLFFSDTTGSRGQLVIASRESQYKILHFHHGGLDKLASVFEDWNFLVPPRDNATLLERQRRERQRRSSLPEEEAEEAQEIVEEADGGAFKQFSVCRPHVPPSELHPSEGTVRELDAEDWLAYFSQDGVIEDDLSLRRRVFFGGLEPQLRSSVWPFLLRCYPYTSTFEERQALTDANMALYKQLTDRRACMEGTEREEFWRNVQCTVEKDVVRTDRSNPCFAGHDNPNLTKMKNILLNFALHRPDIGYTQGMSDIVAPILSEVRCEPDVFWCFTGLMSKTIFVTSPRDHDMEKNLSFLRELLRLMAPEFYEHNMAQRDGHFLLFCHRWILLCFKREFPERSVLSLWEACWSNFQTDYFHLFVAVAIVGVYGAEVTQQNLRADETLLYFTSLAHHMDAEVVIKKARGLLHRFRGLPQVPCGLVGLCELCGPGMWDSGHNPTMVCTGHDDDQPCPALHRPAPPASDT